MKLENWKIKQIQRFLKQTKQMKKLTFSKNPAVVAKAKGYLLDLEKAIEELSN